jgi:hypothetical protein
LDLGSETELRIQIKELLFDDAYLSKVIDDKKSWFMQMEVLDLIYYQFFFHRQYLGATTDHIAVLSTSNTTDLSPCGRSYSLCTV